MPEFPYKRASIILAHAKLFSKTQACKLYDIKSSTFDGWRNRLNNDEKLQKMCDEELNKLAEDWKGETVGTLKLGLSSMQKAFMNDIFDYKPILPREKEAWAKGVDSLARAIRSLGDLAISTTVLDEEDEEDEDY